MFLHLLSVFSLHVTSFLSSWEQKKERECMLLRIAMMRHELQRQRKALSKEIDLRQKERMQLQKKGNIRHTQDQD